MARSAVVDASRIAAFPILADLPGAELDELAAATHEVEIEAGAAVVTLDDYGTAIYFIEQGEVEVRTDGGDPQILGPGDTFGEIGLLLTGHRTATVVARTPMRLVSLSGHDFERIGRVYPSSNACCAASASNARVGRRLRASSSAAVVFMQPPE